MDSLAHGLWSGAAAIAINNLHAGAPKANGLPTKWFAFWGVFPDVVAFGPMVATGLWLRMTGSTTATEHGGHLPHVDLGIPLYPAAHSLVTFAVLYGVVSLVARSPASSLLGWLLHILIDIPTHSFQYHATRFLWPLAESRFDGVAWWTPWLWVCTYAGLVFACILFWRRGWLTRRPSATPTSAAQCVTSNG